MRAQAVLFAVFAFAVAAGLSWLVARQAVMTLESETENRLRSSLRAAGQDWTGIETDGLRVVLTGTAKSEQARFRALEVAGEIVDTSRISDTIDVQSETTEAAPDFSLTIIRTEENLSLIGLVPGKEIRDDVLRRLIGESDDGGAEIEFTDLLQAVVYPAPERFARAAIFAADAAAEMPRSRTDVLEGVVDIVAVLPPGSDVAARRKQLQEALPEGVVGRFDLSAPKPVIRPFIFDATMNTTLRIAKCSAESTSAAKEILLRAAALGADAECDVGLGAPSPDWSNAVILGVDTLETLGGGRLILEDVDISLVAPSSTPDALFQSAISKMEEGLPKVFSLSARRPEASAQEDTGDQVAPPNLRAARESDGTVRITGPVRDAAAADALLAYAAALFGFEAVKADIEVVPDTPDGWSGRGFAMLKSVAALKAGSVSLTGENVTIAGETEDTDLAERLATLFAETIPDADIRMDLTIVEPPAPEEVVALSLKPSDCALRLSAIMSQSPIIFEPNSADIDASSDLGLDEMAKVLRQCGDATFEIGGHTDSQGREQMNLALSQSRAEAVLDAMLSRNVRLSQMQAKGFGESLPIADNGTEEGRAMNRRIEFQLVEEDAPTPEDTPDDETDSAGSEAGPDTAAETQTPTEAD